MKIVIAQLNPIVGDIDGNRLQIIQTLMQINKAEADLVVFPELFLTGYPPKDLLERPWFIEKTQHAIQELMQASIQYPETGVLFGAPLPTGKDVGKGLYNSAVLIHRGKMIATQNKSLLPTYDVFDERRYFDPAMEINTVDFKGETLGISICEDAWNDPQLWPNRRPYDFNPIEFLAGKGATLFINISASPFHVGKEDIRFRLIGSHAAKHRLPFVYVNQVGGNDELIFDGRSLFLDRAGEPATVLPAFEEHVQSIDTGHSGAPGLYVPQNEIESVWEALVFGTSEYMRKCGFSKAVIGLSGGIDSAVTCCLAKEAIGSENVLALSMPSPYSSRGSIEDSRRLAENIGIRFEVISITGIYQAYLETLEEHFIGKEADTTEENIQARIRGNILMAISNKFGHLVLSTGNKSELAVGYCTLYGDMSGGLAVISDVPKTMVYSLAEYINKSSEIIPRAIIEKAPSAELKPGQVDQDSLPPYPVLDQILHHFIEEAASIEEIMELGFDEQTVRWIAEAVAKNEYKRKQAPPGLKVTSKAFGVGRRMPIAARYTIEPEAPKRRSAG
ncbi:MAG: NAD+ synthase [Candidatus Aminicenantes bacterium]|nr:NAD+ synthase [Candidatus Aminicenantes bacterium]